MNIYEVKFKEGRKKRSAYFSSKSKAVKFILSSRDIGLFSAGPTKHEIPKTKEQILKFLNRDNGLG